MDKKAIRADTIFALLAIFSVFCVKFFEAMPKNSPKNFYTLLPYLYLAFTLYDFVAIPLFYFSAAAFLTTVIMNLFRIHVSKTISVILKCVAGLAVLAFWGFVAVQVLGDRPPVYHFFSGYALYFTAAGLIFALGLRKKPAIPGNGTLGK